MSAKKALRRALKDIRKQLPDVARRAEVVYEALDWRWASIADVPTRADIIAEAESLLATVPKRVDNFYFTGTGGIHLYVTRCGDEMRAELVCGPSCIGYGEVKKGEGE